MTEQEYTEYETYPEDKDPVERYNLTIDRAVREEDGTWIVIRTVKQVVTFDKKTWYIREKAIKGMHKTFKKANDVTLKAISSLLSEYDGDFFSKGEWKDNQYVLRAEDPDTVLTEEHHGITEDVSNSKT